MRRASNRGVVPVEMTRRAGATWSSGNASLYGEGILTSTRNGWAHKGFERPLAGLRILVAEDEGLIALEMKRMLEDFGCHVVGPLVSVDEVLKNAHRGMLDGALLDINLRGRQIFEILPELQKLGLRFIIASGYDDVTLFPAPFRAMPRIAKPFDEREVQRVCESVFGSAAMR
jgi:CheY-like chemotaxis protein